MSQAIKLTVLALFFSALSICAGSGGAFAAEEGDAPTGSFQVTFVELGSVNCIPCKQMKPVMDAIRKEYAGKVKVVFHDVQTKEGKAHGTRYGIRVIPTQIFLNKSGKEIFRHEGYYSKDAIEQVLRDAGVQK